MKYQFQDFELNTAKRALRRDGSIIPLPKRSFDVLVTLVSHRDRVLSKDEILDSVWPNQSVSENTLAQALTKLRSVLEDDPRQPTMIRTVHGVGFQWIAAVVESQPVLPGADKNRSRWGLFAGLSLVVIAVSLSWWAREPNEPLGPINEVTTNADLLALTDPPGASVTTVGVMTATIKEGSALDPDLSNSLDSLFQRALSEQPGIRALPPSAARGSSNGLVTLNRDFGATHTVDLELGSEAGNPILGVTLADAEGESEQSFAGENIPETVNAAVLWVGQSLGVDSDVNSKAGFFSAADPFAIESYARGLSALKRGDHQKALELFDVSVSEAPQFLVPRYELALTYRRLGQYERSLSLLETLSERDLNPEVRTKVANGMALALWRMGDYQRADEITESALQNLDGVLPSSRNSVLQNAGLIKRDLGDLSAAVKLLEQAVASSRAIDDRYNLSNALNNLSGMQISLGHLDEAEQSSNEAIALFRAADRQRNLSRALSRLSTIQLKKGNFKTAENLIRQAMEINSKADDRYGITANQLRLGELLLARGQLTDADRLLSAAYASAVEIKSNPMQSMAVKKMGDLALARHQWDQAENWYEELNELAISSGDTDGRIDSISGLADSRCGSEGFAEARPLYIEAMDLAESRDNTNASNSVLLAMSRCSVKSGHEDSEIYVNRLLSRITDIKAPDFIRQIHLLAAAHAMKTNSSGARSHLDLAAAHSAAEFDFLKLLAEWHAANNDMTSAAATMRQARSEAGERWSDTLEAQLLQYTSQSR